MPGAYLWGWDGAVWREASLDAAGHLQVDVVTSGLPLGGATAANQALLIADTGTLVTEQGRCYGWDTAAWIAMEFEAVDVPNLRVKLYDGAVGIDSHLVGVSLLPGVKYALITASKIFGFYLYAFNQWSNNSDGIVTEVVRYNMTTVSYLYGYNGVSFDRLRTYGVGILKVGRAHIGLLAVRMTAVGQVGAAGARKLYWMLLNPLAGNSVVELTDAAAGGGAVVADHFDTTRDGHMITFDPPMEFTTGLYLETFTNMTSITFGYL